MKDKKHKIKEIDLLKPTGCIIPKSIYDKKSDIKWLYRDTPINETDSGWRIFGTKEDKDVIIIDIDILISIEPLFAKIKDSPIDTELELKEDEAGKYFINVNTNERLWF